MTYANSHAESFGSMSKEQPKKIVGQGMTRKHPGPSRQCKEGQHRNCIKKSCNCPCGHQGILR